MVRATPEWIGKTDDTPAPPRVRLRVFEAHGGVCAESGRKIQPGEAWDLDHRIALANGGENRESNLQPVLKDTHRKKTALDVKAKAKSARVRKKHTGIWQAKSKLPGSRDSEWKRKIDGTWVKRTQ